MELSYSAVEDGALSQRDERDEMESHRRRLFEQCHSERTGLSSSSIDISALSVDLDAAFPSSRRERLGVGDRFDDRIALDSDR